LENHGTTMVKNIGQPFEKPLDNHGKHIGNQMENHGKTNIRKPLQTIGKPLEKHKKTIGTPFKTKMKNHDKPLDNH
jgi:hypothetical protein